MAEKLPEGKDGEDLNMSLSEDLDADVSVGDDSTSDDALASSTGSEVGTINKKARIQTPSPGPGSNPFMVQPSPPKFVTFDDLMAAASGVKNMSLAHEIAVDANFKLENLESPTAGIEKHVKKIVHKAFWDSFEAKIKEDPPDFSHAIVLIAEVKELLLALLPPNSRLKTQISEVLDLDLIKQKMENDAFDIYYYGNFVSDLMARICAPARDERIAQMKQIKDVVPLFKEIFEVLDLMKMDMANFTIQQIRPYIQQQSVEYEKQKFDEFLQKQQEAGIDGLELTRDWLSRSFHKLKSLDPASAEGAANQSSIVTPAAILNGAFMEFLQWDLSKLFPETCVLDQSRFLELRERTSELILVTSVMLVTYNSVGQSIAGVQSLKQKLKDNICAIIDNTQGKERVTVMPNIGEQVNKDVEEFLRDHGFPARDETQQMALKGQIAELNVKDNPVYFIMCKRVLSFIQQAIFAKHVEPLKVPAGMSIMEKELSQICGQFLRLISHNRSVFGTHYADIIGKLLERNSDNSSTGSQPVS